MAGAACLGLMGTHGEEPPVEGGQLACTVIFPVNIVLMVLLLFLYILEKMISWKQFLCFPTFHTRLIPEAILHSEGSLGLL
jgi:hypothetical protein